MSVAYADDHRRSRPQTHDRRDRPARRDPPPLRKAAGKASYLAGFGLSFAARLMGGLLPKAKAQETAGARPVRRAAPATVARAPAPPPRSKPRTGPPPISIRRALPVPAASPRAFSLPGLLLRARDWIGERLARLSGRIRTFIDELSSRRDGIREYALVTLAYWGLTITDGAIRMLVLFQFYLLGYTAFQIAMLFLFYEIFGVVTNLFGGWIGANFGLRLTLFGGIGVQVAALAMLALLNPAWPGWLVVGYVMFSQALSGIAKDLTKMSSKSAIKAVVPADADATMYRWVSILTGSKNALKGVGFFVGALLLTVTGFAPSLLIMAAGLAYLLFALWHRLPSDLGRTKEKAPFSSMFSLNRRVNILSAARFFLFGARDVWFIVALPVYLSAIFGWSHLVVGAYLALWTIGYGIVQSLAPKFIAAREGEAPKGHTVYFWALVLAAVPAAIALALGAGLFPVLSIVGGLGLFGVVFAINSAVHSYMIVHYAESEKVAMTVGFYYMANAGGRLVGTILSGLVYQTLGIVGCLWISALFVGASALISTGLVVPDGRAAAPAPARQAALLQPAVSGA